MPGKIKVKVLAGRNLPVMDRASDTTDAFVEIKFGGVTHKTDVCRKSLNPHWNSTEWYRFEDDGIMEILKGTSLASRDEAARAAAVLRWTLAQAQRCSCSGVQLARDLLVLGVPRAHAAALADAADTAREGYQLSIRNSGFMVNKLTDVAASPGPKGTVDTIKLTFHSDEVFTGAQKTADMIIDKSQVKILLAELKKAKKRMDDIDIS